MKNPCRSCLAGLVVWAMASSASADVPRYRPVAVETRFKGDDPARVGRVEPELERRAIEALQYRGVEVDGASTTTVVVQVLNVAEGEAGQADKAVSDYGTHIEVQIDGEKVGEKVTMCMHKGEAELVGCALSGLPDVMHLLPKDDEEEEEVPDKPVPDPGPADKGKKVALAPLGVLGVAGIVVAAAGLGLGVAGSLDLARGEVDDDDWAVGTERTDYSPRGIGLVVGGGAALAVGAALIAVGVIRTKKKQRERSTRVQLDASPGFAGVRFLGRF